MNGMHFPLDTSGMSCETQIIKVSELPKEKIDILKSVQEELAKLAKVVREFPKLSENKKAPGSK